MIHVTDFVDYVLENIIEKEVRPSMELLVAVSFLVNSREFDSEVNRLVYEDGEQLKTKIKRLKKWKEKLGELNADI